MTVTVWGRIAKFGGRVFFGPVELRAGWRLLIFALVAFVIGRLAQFIVRFALQALPDLNSREGPLSPLAIAVTVGVLLAASAVMAKLERRRIADYGLPWRRILGKQFWQGIALGFATITAVVAAMRLAGALSFADGNLHGAEIGTYSLRYLVVFALGAAFEEYFCRGYLLFTLTTGIGFWPAAVLSSILFGVLHTANPGETAFGCVSTGVFGFLFCVILRRTGNLWMPIGFHAAYNWGEAFFYGTTDSGIQFPNRILTATATGPDWLTGGSAGPEGSYLCVAIVALMAIGFGLWRGAAKFPDPAAIHRASPTDLQLSDPPPVRPPSAGSPPSDLPSAALPGSADQGPLI